MPWRTQDVDVCAPRLGERHSDCRRRGLQRLSAWVRMTLTALRLDLRGDGVEPNQQQVHVNVGLQIGERCRDRRPAATAIVHQGRLQRFQDDFVQDLLRGRRSFQTAAHPIR